MSDDEDVSSAMKDFREKFDLDFEDDEELEDMDLSEKDLDHIPTELFELPSIEESLKTLCLEKNNLTKITDKIGKLRGLQELYLRENAITELPASIAKLKNLDSLYLEDNKLTHIGFPPEIGTLPQLKGLCLHRNELKVNMLVKLDCIYIYDCRIGLACVPIFARISRRVVFRCKHD
jgi:Leucine-rich repeat (LRR) protein